MILFFCDEINGFDLYSEYSEDNSEYGNYRTGRNSPRYIDASLDAITYDIYGIELRKTKKAILYKLVVVEIEKGSYKRRYKLGPEKWLAKSCINATHVSEFNRTDIDFSSEFVVTGIDNLYIISIPSWLHYKDPVLREKVFSVKKIK